MSNERVRPAREDTGTDDAATRGVDGAARGTRALHPTLW
jgi:hypothetical protein